MSIWNKILIGFIFLAAIAFFYMGARTLKTHQHWRDIARKQETALRAEKEAETKLLGESAEQHSGEDAEMGIRQTRVELHKLMVDRGRVWYDCKPQAVDSDTGAASVITVLPDPPQVKVKMVLFVFDQAETQNGGRYLGEFIVSAVAGESGGQLQLQPSRKMAQADRERLVRSQARPEPNWALYEVMPQDNHEIFEGLTDAEKTALLPASTVEDYLKDGQLTDPTNPESPRFARKLRDYEVLFKVYHAQQSELVDLWEAATRDKRYIEVALEDANRHKQFRQTEVDKLKVELAKIERERDAVAAHLKALEGKMDVMRATIAKIIKANQEMAGEIARIQLEATRRIDERTRRMAQAEAGN